MQNQIHKRARPDLTGQGASQNQGGGIDGVNSNDQHRALSTAVNSGDIKQIAQAAASEYHAAGRDAQSMFIHLRNAGTALIAIRERCEHGAWLPTLAEHWPGSERAAYVAMNIAQRWRDVETNLHRDANLSVREMRKLLASPKTDAAKAADVAARAADGPKPPPTVTRAEYVEAVERAQSAEANFAEVSSKFQAVEIANSGAENAAHELFARDDRIRALSAQVAEQQTIILRFQRKCASLEKQLKAALSSQSLPPTSPAPAAPTPATAPTTQQRPLTPHMTPAPAGYQSCPSCGGEGEPKCYCNGTGWVEVSP